jgi:hypothetical protein
VICIVRISEGWQATIFNRGLVVAYIIFGVLF